MGLVTLHKARGVPVKQPVCAICVDRTRGKTRLVKLTYGVAVQLCEGHASDEFLTRRGGRDVVVTLMRIWQANGCLTSARHKALDAHLARLAGPPPRAKQGSYAWPGVRQAAERLFARGVPQPWSPGGSPAPSSATPNHPATAPSPAGTDRRWLTTGTAAALPR